MSDLREQLLVAAAKKHIKTLSASQISTFVDFIGALNPEDRGLLANFRTEAMAQIDTAAALARSKTEPGPYSDNRPHPK